MLSLVLLGAAFVLANADLFLIALPILAFALFPFFSTPPDGTVEVTTTRESATITFGATAVASFRVRRTGSPAGRATVRIVPPEGIEPLPDSRLSAELAAGEECELHLRFRAPRGTYDFTEILAELRDELGLSERRVVIPAHASAVVLPRVEPLPELRVRPLRTRTFPGVVHSRVSGAGLEFFGAREYASGDPVRQVNWRALARWDRLITNLYEEERAVDVGIVLDARTITNAVARGQSIFEYSVHAAASIAVSLSRQGNRVGLLSYGRSLDWLAPGAGRAHRARILQHLARVRTGDHVAFADLKYLPLQIFPPRCQLVLVSPLRKDDVLPLRYLHALKFELLVVSPDPISFEIHRSGRPAMHGSKD
ncbi:MAG TPA: DUF58 domain-containing protein, partial [Spirochaetia bacterium]